VDFLADAQRRLQAELEARDAQIAELQGQKREIFDKLVQVRAGWHAGRPAELRAAVRPALVCG